MSSTLSGSTNDIEIRHPELWNLLLCLKAESVDYVIYTKAQENSLISGSIALDMSFGDYLKSLENCVYDNPLLLKPFGKVRVIADSSHFSLVPASIADDEDLAEDVYARTFPDAEDEMSVCVMPRCEVAIVYGLPRGVKSFLQRTFFNPPVCHSLMPLCEYYVSKQAETSLSRMYIHIADGAMKMCLFSKGKLLMANVFSFHSIEDAAYYALNAWQAFSFDALNDEVQLAGDKQLRDQLTPILRKYVNYVMPAIFPAAALRIGHDAVKAPYNLILLALCE